MLNTGVEQRSLKKGKLDGQVFLPEEIIRSILSLLPVKSLLRFRIVCKAWCGLISDPQFINLQLCQANKNPVFVVMAYKRSNTTKRIHLYTYKEEGHQSNPLMEWEVPGASQIHIYPVTCHGLVLFYTVKQIHVCNPSTRKFITLPEGSSSKHLTPFSTQHVGFGFDTSSKKYKVVRIFFREININMGIFDMGCEIFDLCSHTWRTVSDPPYPVSDRFPSSINGILYWEICTAHKYRSAHILSFDLRSEQFGVIAAPPCSEPSLKRIIKPLAVFGDDLYLLVTIHGSPTVDIWMSKCGDNDEWVKMLNIRIGDPKRLLPLAIHDRDVVLRSKRGFCCYNTTRKRFRRVLVVRKKSDDDDNPWNAYMSFLNGARRLQAAFYVESLISPDGDFRSFG